MLVPLKACKRITAIALYPPRFGPPRPRYGPRVNEQIRISQVRLVNQDNEMVGVVPTPEALRMAREAGLDLVEVSPESSPPVCRILDFGKWKYEQSKKTKGQKSKTTELKEVRLGRSMKIDPHDVAIRLNQARKFLMEGHKVQIVQNFRGREMAHKDRGYERMKEIANQLADIAKVEVTPKLAGRRLNMILAPDKAKIDQVKRREAKMSGTSPSAEGSEPQPASKAANPADDAASTEAAVETSQA